jgi:ubiquinone/menaquinone biosynthesis C-methylase UbiE
MSALGWVHGRLVFRRRVDVLRDHLVDLIPLNASVLDVGCGDGRLAWSIQRARGDVAIRGLDVLVREQTHIAVDHFDGRILPYPDRSFDAVMAVDVLHHAEDPTNLLSEAARVSRGVVLIKDHLADPWLAIPRLRLMDRVGNARYGVALPYNYWTEKKWREAFRVLGLLPEVWRERLGLYPPPASWIFDDSLHFIARLRRG